MEPEKMPMEPEKLPTYVPHIPGLDKFYTCTADTINPREVEWLWPGRVPLGMVTMLDGDPGQGKSLITLALAAAVTRGLALPGGVPANPADVLLLAAEDDAARVIRPRLEAAGADLKRCRLIEADKLTGDPAPARFPRDLDWLEESARLHKVRLIVLDPLVAFLEPSINTGRDQDVRKMLAALRAIAAWCGAAVICVRHLNKAAGLAAMYRGGGSIAFNAAVRAGLIVGPHPGCPGRSVLAATKSNLSSAPRAIGYAIERVNGMPVIAWGEECDLTANELVPAMKSGRGPSRAEECARWLVEFLGEFAWPDDELQVAAREAGYSLHNLKDAKARLRRASPALKAKPAGQNAQWWNWIGTERKPDRPRPLAAIISGDPPREIPPEIVEPVKTNDVPEVGEMTG